MADDPQAAVPGVRPVTAHMHRLYVVATADISDINSVFGASLVLRAPHSTLRRSASATCDVPVRSAPSGGKNRISL